MPTARIFTQAGKSVSTTSDLDATWLLSEGWVEGVSEGYEIPKTPAIRLDDHDVRIHDLEDAIANIQGVNVLQDPDFDSWTTPTQPGGWGTFWGVGTRNYFRDQATPYSGRNALGVTVIDSGGGGLAWVGSAEFTVSPGANVAARIFAKATTDTLSRMQIALFTNGPANAPDHFATGLNNMSGPQTILSTEWTEYNASWTVNPGQTRGRIYIGIDSPTPGATFTSYLDRAKAVVTEADVPDDTGWVAPTLLNSWTNYGGGWEAAAYRRINGEVHLRGLVKLGTDNLPLLTLPADYRPATDKIFSVLANTAVCRLDVLANGTVKTNGYDTGGTNAYVSLAGVSFPVG